MTLTAGLPRGGLLGSLPAVVLAGAIAAARPAIAQPVATPPFQRIVDEYRHGDADAAVREVMAWPVARVAEHARLSSAATGWDKAAAALLLTEAGLENGLYGRFPPGLRVQDGAIREHGPHLATAFGLVNEVFELAERERDAALLEFCRRWYVLSFPYGGTQGEFIRVVQRRFEDDPEVGLLLGMRAERLMGPHEGGQGNGGYVYTSHGLFALSWAGEAERRYRRSLESDAGFVRARMHLGRLLYRLDRIDAAGPELERALREARATGDRFTGYLAAMFLGRLHEDRGAVDAAADSYRQAIDIYPDAQSARLALDFLLFVNGSARRDRVLASEVFADDPGDLKTTMDPWHAYARRSAVWDEPARLEAMRGMVRR